MSAPAAGDPLLDGLREIALPVAVVGAAAGGRRGCSTGTLTYVSLAPPTIITALDPASRTLQLVRESRELSISLLTATQWHLAEQAGKRSAAEDKLADLGIPTRPPPQGRTSPGVAGACAVLWCDLVDEVAAGDHRCCISVVAQVELSPEAGPPLLRRHRAYHALGALIGGPEGSLYPV